jgi:hypothetical protein
MNATGCPTACSAVCPKSRAAASFQVMTVPSGRSVKIASPDERTTFASSSSRSTTSSRARSFARHVKREISESAPMNAPCTDAHRHGSRAPDAWAKTDSGASAPNRP